MKKSGGYQDDQSKTSFFNDGNQLFTQIIDENLQFQDYGKFQMKYINKVSQISIHLAENYLKIIEEISSKYIQIENACLRMVMNQKNQQLGFRISKNGHRAEFYGDNLELIEKIKKFVIQSEFQKKYRIIAKIGSDYLSSVYKVQHQISGQKYAAKVIEKSMLTNSSKFEKDQFLNQINILRQVNHKNFLKLEEIHEGEQNVYIITELLEGGPIKQQILSNLLTEQEKIKITHSLFNNLNYLHKQNIYHQDIRYDNILLRDSQDMKTACLINFGKAIQIPSKKNYLINNNNLNQEGMISQFIKRDICSLSIILLSMFTKKYYKENSIVDELLIKKSQQSIQIDYMELQNPIQNLFQFIFTEIQQKQSDIFNCEKILELDIFRIQQKPRNSKNFISKQFLPLLPRRMSKLEPSLSDRDRSVNSIKLPPINRDASTSAEKSFSQSPKSLCLLTNHHTIFKNKSKLSQKAKGYKQNMII